MTPSKSSQPLTPQNLKITPVNCSWGLGSFKCRRLWSSNGGRARSVSLKITKILQFCKTESFSKMLYKRHEKKTFKIVKKSDFFLNNELQRNLRPPFRPCTQL